MAAQRPLWQEAVIGGTLASLAMMPPGLFFRLLEMRIGYYGKKLVEFLLPELPQWLFRVTVLTEHLLIGWISAVPLLWLLRRERHPDVRWIVVWGFVYGSAYYLLINAWLLPLAFGDPYPLQMGFSTVIPSLVVHVVYGLSLSGYFIWRRTAEPLPS